MRTSYKAVLRGNQLEWSDEAPHSLPKDQPVRVSVTILESSASQGQRMAEALAELARLNAMADVTDPAAWERQQRQDRTLPGRDS